MDINRVFPESLFAVSLNMISLTYKPDSLQNQLLEYDERVRKGLI